jgi:predicted aspartyl protease
MALPIALFATLNCNSRSTADVAQAPPPAESAPADAAANAGAGTVSTCPEGTPFTESDGKVLVSVTVNGAGPFHMIIDTGAPISVVDPSVLAEAGAAPYGVTIGSTEIHADRLVSTKLGGGLVGIIGLDTFDDRALTIDYTRSRLWFEPTLDEAALDEAALSACAHIAGAPSVSSILEDGYVYVDGAVEDVVGRFLLDTGATRAVVLESTFSALAAANPRPVLDGFLIGSGAGDFWSRMTSVGRLRIGNQQVEHVFALTAPDGFLESPSSGEGQLLGLLPYEFLHHFAVSLDLRGKSDFQCFDRECIGRFRPRFADEQAGKRVEPRLALDQIHAERGTVERGCGFVRRVGVEEHGANTRIGRDVRDVVDVARHDHHPARLDGEPARADHVLDPAFERPCDLCPCMRARGVHVCARAIAPEHRPTASLGTEAAHRPEYDKDRPPRKRSAPGNARLWRENGTGRRPSLNEMRRACT